MLYRASYSLLSLFPSYVHYIIIPLYSLATLWTLIVNGVRDCNSNGVFSYVATTNSQAKTGWLLVQLVHIIENGSYLHTMSAKIGDSPKVITCVTEES